MAPKKGSSAPKKKASAPKPSSAPKKKAHAPKTSLAPKKGKGKKTSSSNGSQKEDFIKWNVDVNKGGITIITLTIGSEVDIKVKPMLMEMCLDELKRNVSEGSYTLGGLPVTFPDHEDPVVIVKLVGHEPKEGGRDLSVSLMIQKSDLYIIGYLLGTDINGEWKTFVDLNMSNHIKEESFTYTYYDKSIKILNNRLGARVLLKAMALLRYSENPVKRKEGFQCICYHLSEAVRFKIIGKLVCSQMDAGHYPEDVLSSVRWMLNDWKKTSHKLHEDLKDPDIILECACWEDKGDKSENIGLTGHILLSRRTLTTDEKFTRKQLESFISNWATRDNLNPDVCNDIVRAIMQPNERIAKLIVKNSDFVMKTPDLSICVDYLGREYKIKDEDMKRLR